MVANKMWNKAIVLGAVSASAVLSMPVKGIGEQAKPNILIFLIDDLSEGLTSAYGGGVPTPNMDQLAANGVRFTQAYSTAPMCSPARLSLLTGRYPARTGQDGLFRPTNDDDEPALGLDKNEVTLATRLKNYGYTTCISGKWHLGEGLGYMAADRGFDFAFGTVANLAQNKDTGKGEGDFFRGHEVIKSPGWLVTSPMYAEEAVKFLDASREKPFFLYVSFNAAHAPAVSSKQWTDKTAHLEGAQRRKTAQVGEMDEAIGTVMEKLRELGLEEKTLVICTSDNGRKDFTAGLEGLEGSNGLRGDKWKLWEAGIRVPFIVQWKGAISGGRVDDTVISFVDVFPTVMAAAGVEVQSEWNLDGTNLLPLFNGQATGLSREALFWRVGSAKTGITHYAVRQGNWKLVKPTKAGDEPEYLYNLADDRGELTDLSGQFPEKKTQLKALWQRWNDIMPKSKNK